MRYRPEIDGLRAIAVVAVLLFHLDLPYIAGGLLGVDVFFVISGYLITGILLHAMENNSFSIAAFYERRARRILPALTILLVCTSVVAYKLLSLSDYRTYNKSVFSTCSFVSNFYFLRHTSGYFAVNAKQMPLGHTWSLSVEEQFYVLYPLLLFGVRKFLAKRFIPIVLLVLFIASLAACCIAGIKDGNAVFYNSVYRCWELLAGGLLAAGILPATRIRFKAIFLSWTGIGLIVFSFLFFGRIPYNFVFSITSVWGACMVLYGLQESKNGISRLLSWRPVVFVGKCSYSLYLWHWPIIVFANLCSLDPLSPWQKLTILAVSFVLAVLSYRFVEQPFRKHNGVIGGRKKLLVTAAIVLFLTGGAALALGKYVDFTNRSHTDQLMADADRDPFWIEMVKNRKLYEQDTLTHPILIGNKDKRATFFLWGDSHAKALSVGIDSLLRTTGDQYGYLLSFPGIPPLLGVEYRLGYKPTHVDISNRMLTYISQHPEINTVVLDSRWMNYFLNQRKKVQIVDSSVLKYQNLDRELTIGLPLKKIFCASMRFTIDTLRKLNKRIIIVAPVPEIKYPFNQVAIHARLHNANMNDYGGWVADFEKYNSDMMSFLNTLKSGDVQILRADQFFRNGKRFLTERNGHLLYRDGNHISRYGAVEIAKGLQQLLK